MNMISFTFLFLIIEDNEYSLSLLFKDNSVTVVNTQK